MSTTKLLDAKARKVLDPALAAELEVTLAEHLRPCVWVDSVRVSQAKLQPGALLRLFGAKPAEPVLGPLASKLGGRPYAEAGDEWSRHRFLGQLDLTEGAALVPGCPAMGLLGFDLGSGGNLRVRWYPKPAIERCVETPVRQVCTYEARLDFRAGHVAPPWALVESWFPALRDVDDAREVLAPEVADGDFDHRLFGPCSDIFAEYGPSGPSGFVQLFRMAGDQASDTWFGTNWLYLLVPEEGWKAGDLSGAEGRFENA